jgi:hypothetical protein
MNLDTARYCGVPTGARVTFRYLEALAAEE